MAPWCCAPTRPSTWRRAPRINPESTWRLYSALAVAAGVDRTLTVPDGRVVTGRLRTSAGEVALLVNTSPDQVDFSLVTSGTASYTRRAAGTGQALSRLTLPPYEVEVLTRLA